MSISALLYGSETWTFTTANRNRIKSNKICRSIASYRRIDRKRNIEIRENK